MVKLVCSSERAKLLSRHELEFAKVLAGLMVFLLPPASSLPPPAALSLPSGAVTRLAGPSRVAGASPVEAQVPTTHGVAGTLQGQDPVEGSERIAGLGSRPAARPG